MATIFAVVFSACISAADRTVMDSAAMASNQC
jgi:hypothetical protein